MLSPFLQVGFYNVSDVLLLVVYQTHLIMVNKELINKYFDGTCTSQEEQLVVEYLSGKDHQEFISLLDQSWEKLPADDIGEDITQRMLLQLENKINSKLIKNNWMRAAAAAALIFIVLSSALLLSDTHKKNNTAWTSIYNHNSSIQLTILPDSSKVWLTPGSKLSYASFTDENHERSIQLDGEAFFNVMHDAAHPFVIHTGILTTRVLGTSFNIESYQNETAVRVSLVSGLVTVSPPSESIQLHPGEMLDYEKSSQTFKRQQIRINDPEEWIKGSLVFNELPLKEALQRVATRYHLVIHYSKGVESALSDKKVTAIFREENSNEILNNILFISSCYMQQHGSDITVYNMP